MLEQEIDGVTHVVVPKDMWDEMWDVIDSIKKMGDLKWVTIHPLQNIAPVKIW